MSADFAARQTFSDFEIFEKAKTAFKLSWLKRDTTKFNSSSVAITKNESHVSGLMESRTNLLDVTSEQAALALAVSRKDPHVYQVASVIQGEYEENPLIIKILGDHARRTGTPIRYTVFDESGKELLNLPSVARKYNPSPKPLEKIKEWSTRENSVAFDTVSDKAVQLRSAALKGLETHFQADSKTSYGSSILANGKIYFGGVYSSFDHRMNLHSEMVAALAAIMDGSRDIEAIGIISNKFVDELPHMCGCCRQFFSEIQEKIKKEIEIFVFSFDGKQVFNTSLSQYLPSQWHPGLSFDERQKKN